MKKTIILLSLLLLLSFNVFGIIAGKESIIKNFDTCEYMFVNVTGTETIENTEYNLLNCNELETNYWYCDCNNNYDLKILTDIRTHNTYTFDVSYTYKGTVTQNVVRSGGSSRYYYVSDVTDTTTDITEVELKDNKLFINGTEIEGMFINGTLINNTFVQEDIYNEIKREYEETKHKLNELVSKEQKEKEIMQMYEDKIKELEDLVKQKENEIKQESEQEQDKGFVAKAVEFIISPVKRLWLWLFG